MSTLTRDSRSIDERLAAEIRKLRRRTSVVVAASHAIPSVGHVVRVVDGVTGMPKASLVTGDFTKTLTRGPASAQAPATNELAALAFTNLGGGAYAFVYTPEQASVLYILSLSRGADIVSPSEFQDMV